MIFGDRQNSTAGACSLQDTRFYDKPMCLLKEQIAEKATALEAVSQPEPKHRKKTNLLYHKHLLIILFMNNISLKTK